MNTKSKQPSLRHALALLLLAAGAAAASPAEGSLRVTTPTDNPTVSDGPAYYVHSGYTVYRADGKLAAWVPNHFSATDEQVQTVTLPAGKYLVRADATGESVRTVISPARIATLDLSRE